MCVCAGCGWVWVGIGLVSVASAVLLQTKGHEFGLGVLTACTCGCLYVGPVGTERVGACKCVCVCVCAGTGCAS